MLCFAAVHWGGAPVRRGLSGCPPPAPGSKPGKGAALCLTLKAPPAQHGHVCLSGSRRDRPFPFLGFLPLFTLEIPSGWEQGREQLGQLRRCRASLGRVSPSPCRLRPQTAPVMHGAPWASPAALMWDANPPPLHHFTPYCPRVG